MVLKLTVHRVGSVRAELHHHADINDQQVGEPCTFKPTWEKCKSGKFKEIADELAALDRIHENGR